MTQLFADAKLPLAWPLRAKFFKIAGARHFSRIKMRGSRRGAARRSSP
jgi:hypothetical protein